MVGFTSTRTSGSVLAPHFVGSRGDQPALHVLPPLWQRVGDNELQDHPHWTRADERQWKRAGGNTSRPRPAVAPRELCILGTCGECDTTRQQQWNNDFRRRLHGVARAWDNEQAAKVLAKARLLRQKPHCRTCGEVTTLRVALWPGNRTIPEVLAMDLVFSGIVCTYCDARYPKWAIVTAAQLLGDYTV